MSLVSCIGRYRGAAYFLFQFHMISRLDDLAFLQVQRSTCKYGISIYNQVKDEIEQKYPRGKGEP